MENPDGLVINAWTTRVLGYAEPLASFEVIDGMRDASGARRTSDETSPPR